jgi:carbonic anhydrase
MTVVEVIYRYEARDVPARPRPGNAAKAKARLDEGNRAFAELLERLPSDTGPTIQRVVPIDVSEIGLSTSTRKAPRQHPFAAVIGCSDARVPIELIFGEGPNDLFVVRVAGNGLGADALGSLRYAIDHLGGSLKLIVALGHSGCGAVSAAVDVFLQPRDYLAFVSKHAVRNILDRLLVVVQASAQKLADVYGQSVVERRGYRDALIETAIVTNAALTAYTIKQDIRSTEPHGLQAVFGVYLLATRQVWAPREEGASSTGLAHPPADPESFVGFANVLVKSTRIAGILGTA